MRPIAQQEQRIKVTGLGAVTPLGVGARKLHERWVAGECVIANGEARCDDFDPAGFLSRRELRSNDRFTQLTIAACDEAVAEAGWKEDPPCPPERIGCVIATSLGGWHTTEHELGVFNGEGPARLSPLGIPRLICNAAPASLDLRYGWRGESYALVAACASGAQAIGAGARMIQSGAVDAAVVGGADSRFSPYVRSAFELMEAVSPTGICRPFDRRRDGFVPGEGAGVLTLERSDVAEARGADGLGEVVGYGASNDAHHFVAPHPEGLGAADAMRQALASAQLEPQEIDYVNAHGTSTQLNDRAETLAIKEVFGEATEGLPISSTKSAIGHLQGAAGAVETIATLLALRDRVAPPTLGLEEPDEGLDLDYVPGSAKPLPERNGGSPLVGISNSFGFGGHNVAVVVRAA
jgi:3-oxoacyl-[acyl-carrier-protein] synthase II